MMRNRRNPKSEDQQKGAQYSLLSNPNIQKEKERERGGIEIRSKKERRHKEAGGGGEQLSWWTVVVPPLSVFSAAAAVVDSHNYAPFKSKILLLVEVLEVPVTRDEVVKLTVVLLHDRGEVVDEAKVDTANGGVVRSNVENLGNSAEGRDGPSPSDLDFSRDELGMVNIEAAGLLDFTVVRPHDAEDQNKNLTAEFVLPDRLVGLDRGSLPSEHLIPSLDTLGYGITIVNLNVKNGLTLLDEVPDLLGNVNDHSRVDLAFGVIVQVSLELFEYQVVKLKSSHGSILNLKRLNGADLQVVHVGRNEIGTNLDGRG